MKKMTTAILGFVLCLTTSAAYAEPMYYTFQGNITHVDNHYGLIDPGISVGDPVSYTFLLDFARKGEFTRNNGENVIVEDDVTYDYFYTDYISGSAFGVYSDGGRYNGPYDYAEMNFGYNSVPYSGMIYGNEEDNHLHIGGDDFYHGMTSSGPLVAGNWVYNAGGFSSGIYASVVVVPEPATIWLFGSGALGLVGAAKRKNNS